MHVLLRYREGRLIDPPKAIQETWLEYVFPLFITFIVLALDVCAHFFISYARTAKVIFSQIRMNKFYFGQKRYYSLFMNVF